jgi:hypothetical protein
MRLRCPWGLGGVGFLTTRLSNGGQISVEFKAYEVKLLLVLRRAREEDFGVAAGARGWRSRASIACEIAARTGYSLEVGSISAYAVTLLRKFSAAVSAASGGEKIPLIERRRKLGFRLARGVQIDLIEGGGEGDG